MPATPHEPTRANKAVKASTGFSLKDQLFNNDSVNRLAKALVSAEPNFKATSFKKAVLLAFPTLSLKQRIAHMVTVLAQHLPDDFNAATQILNDALPAPLDPTLSDDDFGEFIWIVPGEYIARFGCNAQRLSTSLAFLQQSTQRFSAENAIRPFLTHFASPTLAFLTECTQHTHYHVRRLASEGTRPLLPWSPRVTLPQARVLAILDQLYDDPTRYVTRSVANALNDYTKTVPEAVIQQLGKWQKQAKQRPEELQWMTKHALRTLVKQSHPGAMQLMGLTTTPKFKLQQLKASDSVKIGNALIVTAKITALSQQTLNIGLRVYFRKANGEHGSKLYKVKQSLFEKNGTFHVEKRIALRPMTTRTLYPGTHYVAVEVNGIARGKQPFELHR